jgi:hypothetical protein
VGNGLQKVEVARAGASVGAGAKSSDNAKTLQITQLEHQNEVDKTLLTNLQAALAKKPLMVMGADKAAWAAKAAQVEQLKGQINLRNSWMNQLTNVGQ